MSGPRFVAEVSSNHARAGETFDLGRALAFVDAAADVGCRAVKFQQFKIDTLFAPEVVANEPDIAARRAWELPDLCHEDLAGAAHGRGLQYACTPFDLPAVEQLAEHVDFFKLASYQLLWHDLMRAVARAGRPVVLATGMAELDEVRAAVDVLREAGVSDLELLHCVSAYPTPPGQANLAAIETLRHSMGVPTGWSDHTVDPRVIQRAVRRFDARTVEFHLDLDGEGAEYAGGHCWLPERIGAVIAELADPAGCAGGEPAPGPFDGDGVVEPRACEREEREWRTDPSDGLRPLLETRAAYREVASCREAVQ
jgi:N-acetylneuraminate synthase